MSACWYNKSHNIFNQWIIPFFPNFWKIALRVINLPVVNQIDFELSVSLLDFMFYFGQSFLYFCNQTIIVQLLQISEYFHIFVQD